MSITDKEPYEKKLAIRFFRFWFSAVTKDQLRFADQIPSDGQEKRAMRIAAVKVTAAAETHGFIDTETSLRVRKNLHGVKSFTKKT